MRCFIAVDIDNTLKAKIASLQNQIRIPGIKLIEPQNLHFTLKFLGEVDDGTIAKVKERLDSLKDFNALDIGLSYVGAFPNANYARVVWIGSEKLTNLQNHVNDLLSPLFKKDPDIKPHLTIARIKFLKDKQKLQKFLKENANMEIGSMQVKEILLKKSILTREGPVYENLEKFELD
jgi:2'-5' RNA ligase